MANSCCVTGCKNESYPGSSFSFHRFLKNENQKLNWGNAVPGKISKLSVVCSAYFKCDDFIPGYTKKMLKPDAVPSIFPKVVSRDSCPAKRVLGERRDNFHRNRAREKG